VPEVPAAPPPPAPVELFADVPELWRMSPAFRQSVPDMTISVHVYSPDERRRFIIIDRRKYWEGDQLNGGVLIEAILPQGVVFNLNGQQFKLISG
jgi:type II secretory pathway component PulC